MGTTVRKIKGYVIRDWMMSYLFLVPAFGFFLLFVAYPMVKGVYISFFDYSLRDFSFIGLDNYISLIKDDNFRKSMGNTLLLVLITVPIVIIFSLFISMNIYKKKSLPDRFSAECSICRLYPRS